MDELDIKEIWKRQRVSTPELPSSELDEMMYRSRSIVDKLRKVTRIEHISNIVVSGLMIIVFMIRGEWIISGAILVIMIPILYYYKNLYRSLELIQPDADVKIYLNQVHRKLREFIKKYNVSYVIIFTTAFGVSIYIGLLLSKNVEERLADPVFYTRLILVYTFALVFCFILIHLLYGRKAKQIKEMIKELEEEF